MRPNSRRQARLLVDGYNIIGSWHTLCQTRDKHGLEASRRQLIEILINFSPTEAYETEIVFDAHYQNDPAHREEFSDHVSVYYTDYNQTADTYIERICAGFHSVQTGLTCHRARESNLLQPIQSRLIVATSDTAQKLTAIGYGAEWLSAKKLEALVNLAASKTKRKSRSNHSRKGRFLFNSLDAEAQQALMRLRYGKR